MKDGLKGKQEIETESTAKQTTKDPADTIRQKRSNNNREDMLSDIFCIFIFFHQNQV